MIIAIGMAIAAGLLHAYGLSEESAGSAGAAFGFAFGAIVVAIAALPPALAKALDQRGSDRN